MINGSKRFWAWPEELKQGGILGINRLNVSYIFEKNPRHLYPRVDNKLITKEILAAGDYDTLTRKTAEVIGWIKEIRAARE